MTSTSLFDFPSVQLTFRGPAAKKKRKKRCWTCFVSVPVPPNLFGTSPLRLSTNDDEWWASENKKKNRNRNAPRRRRRRTRPSFAYGGERPLAPRRENRHQRRRRHLWFIRRAKRPDAERFPAKQIANALEIKQRKEKKKKNSHKGRVTRWVLLQLPLYRKRKPTLAYSSKSNCLAGPFEAGALGQRSRYPFGSLVSADFFFCDVKKKHRPVHEWK